MRFDDRLLTVLNQPAGDRHDLAVRWRQLVDLVARAGANAGSATVARAMDSIRADAAQVDEQLRAAAARAVAALPLPLALLEYFATDGLPVSAPVLAAASLETGQWKALLHVADDETRRFIETLHPDLREASSELTDELVVAPPAPEPQQPVAQPAAEPRQPAAPAAAEPEKPVAPSLHEVVERIERRRRARAMHRRGMASAAADTSAGVFRWETGPGGEIAWVEGVPRGLLVGRSIARSQPGEEERLDPQVVRAFASRAPFRDAALVLAEEGPLAGGWKISGVPAFEPVDGRFAGYRGIALRDEPDSPAPADAPELLADPDSVRELVHEIKTPLNAIIGFAEIIEGQFLGPAEGPYRDRAREIVRQAALLLAAIDDLDFAARLHSSDDAVASRVDLGQLIEQAAPPLRQLAEERGVSLDASSPATKMIAATEPELADRLVHRLCSCVIDLAQPGERLKLALNRSGERWRLAISKPAAIGGLSEDELLGAGPSFDEGFPLRLVRGLARIARAEVSAPRNVIALDFRRA